MFQKLKKSFTVKSKNSLQNDLTDGVDKQKEKGQINNQKILDLNNIQINEALQFQQAVFIGKSDVDTDWASYSFETKAFLILEYIKKLGILSNIINDYTDKVKDGRFIINRETGKLGKIEKAIIQVLQNRQKMNNHNAFSFQKILETIHTNQWLYGEYFMEWDCVITVKRKDGEILEKETHPINIRILSPLSYTPFLNTNYNLVDCWKRLGREGGNLQEKERYGEIVFYRHFPNDDNIYSSGEEMDTPFPSNVYKTKKIPMGYSKVDKEGVETTHYNQSFLTRSKKSPYGVSYNANNTPNYSTPTNPLGYYIDVNTNEKVYLNSHSNDSADERGYSPFFQSMPTLNEMIALSESSKPLMSKASNQENIVVGEESTIKSILNGIQSGLPTLFGSKIGKGAIKDDDKMFSSALQQNSGKLPQKQVLLYEKKQELRSTYGLAVQEYNIDPKYAVRDTSLISFLNNVKTVGEDIAMDINNFIADVFFTSEDMEDFEPLFKISYNHFPALLRENIATIKSMTATAPIFTVNELRKEFGAERIDVEGSDKAIIFLGEQGKVKEELDEDTAREQKKKIPDDTQD